MGLAALLITLLVLAAIVLPAFAIGVHVGRGQRRARGRHAPIPIRPRAPAREVIAHARTVAGERPGGGGTTQLFIHKKDCGCPFCRAYRSWLPELDWHPTSASYSREGAHAGEAEDWHSRRVPDFPRGEP